MESCPATCADATCDYWSPFVGFDCDYLTIAWGCDCDGCSLCSHTPATPATPAPTPMPMAMYSIVGTPCAGRCEESVTCESVGMATITHGDQCLLAGQVLCDDTNVNFEEDTTTLPGRPLGCALAGGNCFNDVKWFPQATGTCG